jgi:hypothetical protein
LVYRDSKFLDDGRDVFSRSIAAHDDAGPFVSFDDEDGERAVFRVDAIAAIEVPRHYFGTAMMASTRSSRTICRRKPSHPEPTARLVQTIELLAASRLALEPLRVLDTSPLHEGG